MNHWGKSKWIRNYWLEKMENPFPEPYSIRQAFYSELPNIVKFVPEYVRENPKWAHDFYISMCKYLGELVLDRKASYHRINILNDSGASEHILQDITYVKGGEKYQKDVDYPIEVWVENNATYNSLISLFEYEYNLNLISQRGFAKVQQIEPIFIKLNRDVELILNLTDFDPSGYCMPSSLQDNFKRIGLNIKVEHIGIMPHQIPEDRKSASLVFWKKTDPRAKMFLKEFAEDPMVKNYQGYEIQALNPSEIRDLVRRAIKQYID